MSGAGGKSAEREREGRGAGSGCHKIGLSCERQIGRSRSAHMHWWTVHKVACQVVHCGCAYSTLCVCVFVYDQGHRLFFTDGKSRIDYVLVWSVSSPENNEDEKLRMATRRVFEQNLRHEGLQLEYDEVLMMFVAY